MTSKENTFRQGKLSFLSTISSSHPKKRVPFIFREVLVRQSNWQGVKGESPSIQRFSKPE
jgi:hypothetical protein